MNGAILCHVCRKPCPDKNRKCNKCNNVVIYCSRKCSRAADAVKHEKQCGRQPVRSREIQRPEQATPNNASFRFKVGDVVYCRMDSWVQGIIVQSPYKEYVNLYPYQVQLCCFINNSNYICVPRDDDSFVRKCRSSLELLLVSVRCGDSVEEFQEILDYYDIDLEIIGSQVLLETITCNNVKIFGFLLAENEVNISILDERKRNILHLAVIYKVYDIVEMIVNFLFREQNDILKDYTKHFFILVDKDGHNVLHHLTLAGDFKVMEWYLKRILEVERRGKRFYSSNSYINFAIKNKEGYTAEDMAKASGRNDMAALLNKYHMREKLFAATNNFWSYDRLEEQESKAREAVQGIDLTDLSLFTPCLQQHVINTAFDLVEVSGLSLLKWLVTDWHLHIHSNINSSWVSSHQSDLVRELVVSAAGLSKHDYEAFFKDKDGILEKAQNGLFRNSTSWDGKTDLPRYFEHMKSRDSYDSDHQVDKYIKIFLIKCTGGDDLVDKLKMLKWLVVTCRLPCPPPHFFVTHGRWQLLIWLASDPRRLDMSAPVDKELRRHCKEIAWLGEVTGRGSSTGLRVGEVLCMLAAGLGEYGVLKMLLKKHVHRKGVLCAGGRTLLHIAAQRGQVLVLKYLVAHAFVPVDALTLTGLAACHLAITNGHLPAVQFLMEAGSDVLDGSGMSINWHASKSSLEWLVDWAAEERNVADQRYISSMMIDHAPSTVLMEYIERCQLCPKLLNEYSMGIYNYIEAKRYFSLRFHCPVFDDDSDGSDTCSERGDIDDDILRANQCFDVPGDYRGNGVTLFLFKVAICKRRFDFMDWALQAVDYTSRFWRDAAIEFTSSAVQYALDMNLPDVAAYLKHWGEAILVNRGSDERMKTLCSHLKLLFMEGRSVEEIEATGTGQQQLYDLLSEEPSEFTWSYENLLRNESCYCDDCNRYIDSPLDYAAHHNLLHLVDWMLSRCSLTEEALVSALGLAALRGHVEVVELVVGSMRRRLDSSERRDNSRAYFAFEIISVIIQACGEPYSIQLKKEDFEDQDEDFEDQEEDFEDQDEDFEDQEEDFEDQDEDFEDQDEDLEDHCYPHIIRALLPVAVELGCDKTLSQAQFLGEVADRLSDQDREDYEKGYFRPSNVFKAALEHLLENDTPDAWDALTVIVESNITDISLFSTLSEDNRDSLISILIERSNIFARLLGGSNDVTAEMREQRALHCFEVFLFLMKHGYQPKLQANFVLDALDEFKSRSSDLHMGLRHLLPYFVEHCNLNIQTFELNHLHIGYDDARGFDKDRECAEADSILAQLKEDQRRRWTLFESLSKGSSLAELGRFLESSGGMKEKSSLLAMRDDRNRTVVEAAVVSDRKDVVEWLVQDVGLTEKDVGGSFSRLTDLAKGAGASRTQEALSRIHSQFLIPRFCSSHFRRRKCMRRFHRMRRSAALIQSVYRMRLVRQRYGPLLKSRRGSYDHFKTTWCDVLSFLSQRRLPPCFRWADVRRQYEMYALDEEAECVGSATLTQLTKQAAAVDDEAEEDLSLGLVAAPLQEAASAERARGELVYSHCVEAQTVEMSVSVTKWVQTADERFKDMFRQRLERLSSGDRSYALSKRLSHCSCPIYESKLDAGQRILWTPLLRGQLRTVMVWFVSKHDNVPHCLRLIEKSMSRTTITAPSHATDDESDSESEILQMSEEEVLLDPMGNTPLKIYVTRRSELPLLTQSGWSPPLLLNRRERDVCEQQGTVLLLGRSGTGKTVCLCHRMIADRSVVRGRVTQLFVSRSRRLCQFVSQYQDQVKEGTEGDRTVHFLTLDRFMNRLDDAVSGESCRSDKRYVVDGMVDFQRFRDQIFPKIRQGSLLDALVVWTQIRSFIKGSIECVLRQQHVSSKQYLDFSVFAKDRCRLQIHQRKEVYQIFQRYQEVLGARDYWDSADRVLDLLVRAKLSDTSLSRDYSGQGGPYDKVYVDEVQDYSQSELLLFFLAAGLDTDALFLAGDPAQAVVEGVDFRFEEVRAIVHKLTGGQARLHRPVHLLTNFRSHTGILNVAGAVVDMLLKVFPGSANVLPADRGLFQGPRPAWLQTSDVNALHSFLARNERLVVICPDEMVTRIRRELSEWAAGSGGSTASSPLVLGVRASKGLEFSDVLLLNYFSDVGDGDQRHWKTLFSVREGGGGVLEDEGQAFPQLEAQLKVLYTAITRCCCRLLLVESRATPAGQAFFRYLGTKGLAEPFRLDDLKAESMLMTADEWRARGLELVVAAELEVSPPENFAASPHFDIDLLERSRECFRRAGDVQLTELANIHLATEALRRRLFTECIQVSKNLSPVEEMDAASLVLRCLRLGVYLEVRAVCALLERCIFEPVYFRNELLRQSNMLGVILAAE